MISQTYRFHGHSAMKFAYSRGQTVRSSSLAVRYVLNPRRNRFRVAVVVSRKVHKSAVVRNRIRRRIYELIRSRQDAIAQPYDMIITVFDCRLATVTATELSELVAAQLTRADIIVR